MIFHDLGLSENSVPLNPLDYHHFPYHLIAIWGYTVFSDTSICTQNYMYIYIYIMYSIAHLSIESYGDLGIPKLEKRAAHVRLERHPAKIQKVESQKVYFLTFRLFFFPLDSQRFKFCTFSWACSAGKASGKNSNSQKVKSQKVYFSTFRN